MTHTATHGLAADPSSNFREVLVSLGDLAYSGRARSGSELKFDASQGLWSLIDSPSASWREIPLSKRGSLPALVSFCGAALMSGAVTFALWPRQAADELVDPTLVASSLIEGVVQPLGWAAMVFTSTLQAGLTPSALLESPRMESSRAAVSPVAAPLRTPSRSVQRLPTELRGRPDALQVETGERKRSSVSRLSETAGGSVVQNPSTVHEFSRPVARLRAREHDTVVAILNESTIVVPNSMGVPTPVRIGERLPSGATLLQVDPDARLAVTDHGPLSME